MILTMKKPRKEIKPELRVRIDKRLFRALRLAVVRVGSTTPDVVEAALSSHAVIKRELEE